MWQRIQTLYFVLVVLLMTAAVLLPNAEFFSSTSNLSYLLDARGLLELNAEGEAVKTIGTNPLIYLFGIIFFLATYSIFGFKNRKRQFRLATINFILILIYSLVLAGYIYFVMNKLEASFTLKYPVVFSVIALIFNYLGMRGVMKDEKLVKSIDRLR